MRGVAHDYHLGPRIDVNRLAMDTARHIGAMRIVAHPPLIAVRPAGQCCVTSRGKLFGVTAPGDVVHHAGRYDLAAIAMTAISHQFAKPGEVTQGRIQTSTAAFDAQTVDGVVGVLLRLHRLPNAL